MGPFDPVVRISRRVVDSFPTQLSARGPVTSQSICDDLPRFRSTCASQPVEETLGCLRIPARLKQHLYNIAVLVYSTPQIVHPTVGSDENLIDEKRITEATAFTSQSTCERGT